MMRISGTVKQLLLADLLVCVVAFAIALLGTLFVYPFEAPGKLAAGVALGCASSLVKVFLLDRSLHKVMDMEGQQAKNAGTAAALARYFLTIAALLLAVFLRDIFGVFGLIIGILSLQFAGYLVNFWQARHKPPAEAKPGEEANS